MSAPPSLQTPRVERVFFTRARVLDVEDGLLGFLVVHIGGLRLEGLTLRQTLTGKLSLQYPRNRRGIGTVCRPTDEVARVSIERQILAELERQGVLS